MELRRCLSLVLVTALMMAVSVEGIQLTMNPITIVDEKTTTLEMKCETNAPADDRVYAIKIFKSPKFDNTPPLAIVDVDNTARVDSSIQQRATASGSITSAAGSNLVLTFNNAITCNDQGDYLCEYNSRLASLRMVNRTLQATSDPNNIVMVARPTMFTYNFNETVELMCSGNVGKPVVGNWMWETRDTFGSTWTSLRPGLTPVDETPTSSSLCQMTGRSTLTFQVRMEDDNRMYRCYFRDSLHSGNFTFQVRGTSTAAPAGSTGNGDNAAQAGTGMIVGIVLGALAAIAIIVVLVFFFVIKKKRDKGNDYDTGEGKNGPAAHTEPELHGNPVYTLPSTHAKYALDNEALDAMETTTDDDPPVIIDPRKKKELEEEQQKKQKTKSVLSGLQSNQLFQRRSMKNKDKDERPNSRHGVENQAMDGNGKGRDQDRHGRSRRDPHDGYPEDGRRPRDRDYDRHSRDHYQPDEAPYPESNAYDHSFDDDGTDNRAYVPPEAIGSSV